MKEGWKYKRLGEVCGVYNGLWKGKKPPYINVGVIRNANFTKDFTLKFDNIEYLDVEVKQYSSRKLQKGDLIIEKSGGSEKQPVGRAVVFDREEGNFSFSNFTSVLRIKDKSCLYYRYLYLYLLFSYSRGDTLKMQKATTGIHNIDFKEYLNMSVPVPPLSEQQEIVSRLDSAFAKIDAVKANAEKQLNDAKALFQKELSKAMTPKEGWEEKKLSDIGETQTGATPSKNDKSNYGDFIPFIRPTEINYDGLGNINYKSEMSLSEKGLENGRLFKGGSIFMVCIGATISKVAISTKDVSCNQQINVITPRSNINAKFVFHAMTSNAFKNKVLKEGMSAQATLPIISKGKWEKLTIPVPPLSEQQAIASHLDTLSEKLKAVEEKQKTIMAECDAMKQALLREVFE